MICEIAFILLNSVRQCYDLRFPEIGIALTQMGADILTYPSAFTFETGALHWETLLRARAIENQCYVIAAAQTGLSSPRRKTWGHSMVSFHGLSFLSIVLVCNNHLCISCQDCGSNGRDYCSVFGGRVYFTCYNKLRAIKKN